MKAYDRVLAYVLEHPWAILPSALEAICEILALRLEGKEFTTEEIEARIGAPRGESGMRQAGSIAVLPLYGIIAHRMNMMTEISGGTSTEAFGGAFRSVVSDPSIGAIVIDVDSPGGNVLGVQELADQIHAARGTKPIIAHANATAASAAYWLASQADEVIVTPSGQVGGIGVLAQHDDLSRAEDGRGIKRTFIASARYKAEGNSSEPLTDAGRAHRQARVMAYHDAFVQAVVRGRNVSAKTVEERFGEGRVVGAAEALRAGMVDRVEPMAETIERLAHQMAKPPGARADSDASPVTAGVEAGLPAAALATDSLERRRRRLRLPGTVVHRSDPLPLGG